MCHTVFLRIPKTTARHNVEEYTFHPIGYVRTRSHKKYDAPRQPGALGSEGRVVLYPGHNYEQALEDLDGFEKIWLVFVFDRNTNWKPKVLPPHGSTKKRGVFATRSPHRPNPIGLSLVDLVSIKGRTLEIANLDLLDRTPILDIKPYLPGIEAFPNARSGWTRGGEESHFELVWKDTAERDPVLERHLRISVPEELVHSPSTYPLPHPYRRIERLTNDTFEIAKGMTRIRFSVDGGALTVEEVFEVEG